MKFERKILIGALASGLVSSIVAIIFIWHSSLLLSHQITLTAVLLLLWIIPPLFLKARVAFSLRTISNLMGALREGDYSFRVKGACRDDALGELILEINSLTSLLYNERLGAIEASALLRKILAEIDVALFGFDESEKLCLINESAEKLLGQNHDALINRTAAELGLLECLAGPVHQVLDLTLPTATGRWELRRATYREKGLPRQLIFLSDITHVLHKQERSAWRQLIQILRHELNNSLTPIRSVAQSLQTNLKEDPNLDNGIEDLQDGLEIIAERSEILRKFIESYSQLTRLPEPTFDELHVSDWIEHVAGLEQRVSVEVCPGSDLTIQADRSQLDQLLINVISNAAEASLEKHSTEDCQIAIGWTSNENILDVWVDDNGPGYDPEKDLFVPFFTTKQQGSGIGLALSRQIAEAHGGSLLLENHADQTGCRATLRLPICSTLAEK